jgi:enoyl-CoA hydratase
VSGIDLQIDAQLATLTLNNPAKLNALTSVMLDQLEAHCATLDDTPGVRAVLLCGAGDRAFCVGADIKEWGDLTPDAFARNWVRRGHRAFDRLARLTKPTIAVIHGHAFGGGLELAAACDIRIMAPNASLALPEPKIGIVPGWSGTQRLTRLLPEPVLKEMLLFGRPLNADRAYSLGFIAAVAADPLAIARDITAALDEASERATETSKWMIHAAVGEDRAAMIEALGAGMSSATSDKAEGVAAFREKRPASFPDGDNGK